MKGGEGAWGGVETYVFNHFLKSLCHRSQGPNLQGKAQLGIICGGNQSVSGDENSGGTYIRFLREDSCKSSLLKKKTIMDNRMDRQIILATLFEAYDPNILEVSIHVSVNLCNQFHWMLAGSLL